MPYATLLMLSARPQLPDPVLWIRPTGEVAIAGRVIQPTLSPGTRAIRSQVGVAYDFDGKRSGMLIPDVRDLEITDSFTVCTWIYPRSYVNDGSGAQILFRGDDRNGVDPFTLVIHGDGTVNFSVQDAADRGFHITAELKLRRWTHVMANWDSITGRLMLFLNGEYVAFATTTVRPFGTLDPNWAPGVGIGNVQNEKGPHNQPFNGQLADLRVYRGVWSPSDLLIRKPDIPPAHVSGPLR